MSTPIPNPATTELLFIARDRAFRAANRLNGSYKAGWAYEYEFSIVCMGEHVKAEFAGKERYEHATAWLNMLADKWEAESNANQA